MELDDAWHFGLHLGVICHLYASSTTITPSDGNPSEGDTQRFFYPYLGLRVGFDLGL